MKTVTEILTKHLESFRGIRVSCISQETGTIWVEAKDVSVLNTLLWAGCRRYFNWNDLFDIYLDIGDPERCTSSLSIRLQMKGSLNIKGSFEAIAFKLIRNLSKVREEFPKVCNDCENWERCGWVPLKYKKEVSSGES